MLLLCLLIVAERPEWGAEQLAALEAGRDVQFTSASDNKWMLPVALLSPASSDGEMRRRWFMPHAKGGAEGLRRRRSAAQASESSQSACT